MSRQPLVDALPVATDDDPAQRLASLFDVHHDRLYRLARRLVPSTEDALDLVQETFLKVARSRQPQLSSAAHEEAWLVRILINIRRDQWRKASVRHRHDSYTHRDGKHFSPGGDPEATLIARTTVWQALDRLPPRRRAVVVMHELEGLDAPAIAALLGVSAITVRWHLSKGRKDMAHALQPYTGDTHE